MTDDQADGGRAMKIIPLICIATSWYIGGSLVALWAAEHIPSTGYAIMVTVLISIGPAAALKLWWEIP